LSQVGEHYAWICHAHYLMTNHHLLIEIPEVNLSKGMRQLLESRNVVYWSDGARWVQRTTITAIVNGEIITKETLSTPAGLNQIFQVVFTKLPQGFGTALLSSPEGTAFLDRYQRNVFGQLIDSRLLVQLAKERGIEVDESKASEQIESHVDQIMQQNQLALDKIDGILRQQGSKTRSSKAPQ